eukprot:6189043-Pleurochrysis_carterae.AAC.1
MHACAGRGRKHERRCGGRQEALVVDVSLVLFAPALSRPSGSPPPPPPLKATARPGSRFYPPVNHKQNEFRRGRTSKVVLRTAQRYREKSGSTCCKWSQKRAS